MLHVSWLCISSSCFYLMMCSTCIYVVGNRYHGISFRVWFRWVEEGKLYIYVFTVDDSCSLTLSINATKHGLIIQQYGKIHVWLDNVQHYKAWCDNVTWPLDKALCNNLTKPQNTIMWQYDKTRSDEIFSGHMSVTKNDKNRVIRNRCMWCNNPTMPVETIP